MTGTLRLMKLRFAAGIAPGTRPLEVDVPTTMVLVGPNNTGKSLALREIEDWCWNETSPKRVLAEVVIDLPRNDEELDALVEPLTTVPPEGQHSRSDHQWIGYHSFRPRGHPIHTEVSLRQLKAEMASGDTGYIRDTVTRAYCVRLDGRTRFELSDPKPTGDLHLHPQNHL